MNVVLADDHPIVMIGIRNALLPVKEIRIRGEADSASGLIRLLEHETPDILITDFYMPGSRQGDGIGLVTYVQRNFPAVRLIVLTMLTNPAVLRAIVDAGVQGLLLKSAAGLEIIHPVPCRRTAGERRRSAAAAGADAARTRSHPPVRHRRLGVGHCQAAEPQRQDRQHPEAPGLAQARRVERPGALRVRKVERAALTAVRCSGYNDSLVAMRGRRRSPSQSRHRDGGAQRRKIK